MATRKRKSHTKKDRQKVVTMKDSPWIKVECPRCIERFLTPNQVGCAECFEGFRIMRLRHLIVSLIASASIDRINENHEPAEEE